MTDIAPPPQVVTPGYTGPERRTRERERQWREDVNRRFDAGSEKMNTMHRDLQANTVAAIAGAGMALWGLYLTATGRAPK
jgi:hypothetical protein